MQQSNIELLQETEVRLLQEANINHGEVVLMKTEDRYTPMFYCDSCYPIGIMDKYHTVNNQLSFSNDDECGYFFAEPNVFSLPKSIFTFSGGEIKVGNVVLIFTGGYENTSKRNWELGFYCGIMNNEIIAAKYYKPETRNFSGIKGYPAMGKYLQ